MSGGLSIDHGGAIAVDSQAMRDVGGRMLALASTFHDARSAMRRAWVAVSGSTHLSNHVDADAMRRSADTLDELEADIQRCGSGTVLMADAFEIVELRAEAEALALTDEAAAASMRARADQMLAADVRLAVLISKLLTGWHREQLDGVSGPGLLGGPISLILPFGTLLGSLTGLGTIRPGERLTGKADPVSVTPVRTSRRLDPPASLRDAFGRMPSSGGAQVAVEKYSMGDGTTRYIAYVKGTQNAFPWEAGGRDPWDMKSNAELYTGKRSASYQATVAAIRQAGASAGDRVDIVAHSQGGMIGSHLAMEDTFDVNTLMTAGSPAEPTLDDDQTLIQLRHSDDPVSALAGGGSPAGTGSPDSFVATREGDPLPGLQDLMLKTHVLETYQETATMIDDSSDPRAEALDAYWSDLGEAVSVERTEYLAERK